MHKIKNSKQKKTGKIEKYMKIYFTGFLLVAVVLVVAAAVVVIIIRYYCHYY